MADVHLPKLMGNNTRFLSVPNGNVKDSNDYLIIMGKSHGGMRFSYVSLDPVNNSLSPKLSTVTWARLFDLVDFATCVFRNCLYVLGGREKSTGRLCREVHKYDPYLARWRQCEEMRKPRANHTATAIWGKIFVFGGMTSSTDIASSVESYEPLTDEWAKESDLPEPRKDHACVSTETHVYIMGGTSPTQVANDNAWVLSRSLADPMRPDTASYEWTNLPDPKQLGLGYRLARHMTVICQDRIYSFGGMCHGQTTDGVSFIRTLSQQNTIKRESSQRYTNEIKLHHNVQDNLPSHQNGIDSEQPQDGETELKWLIGTSAVIEAYKIHDSLPDFSLDPELEEVRQREREEEEKKRKKAKTRQRMRMRGRHKTNPEEEARRQREEEEEKREREEEEARKREDEERLERMRNRTFWKTELQDMPSARCAAGTYVAGHKIYVIGGHRVEDDSRSAVLSVDYYHVRKKQWFHAFDFPGGELSDVQCCVLNIPSTNRDFRPMTYSGCKWVMW